MILLATGWSYRDLMMTPPEVVVEVARLLAERGER